MTQSQPTIVSSASSLLTFNAGSSSIKFALFDRPELTLRLTGELDGIGQQTRFRASASPAGETFSHEWPQGAAPPDHAAALAWLTHWLQTRLNGVKVSAIGHRVVHGGADFDQAVLVDDAVLAKLRLLEPLAPLHQPHNLAGIEAAQRAFGQLPQVACFDTAFHRHQPFVKDCFALPRVFYEEGVRRYGFHGLSYEFIADHLKETFPVHASGRVIVAHLGNGASMCGMLDGHSVASTMGFSALDGLPMGTRCGQLDPGVLLYLMQDRGMNAQEISDLLYKESGLKGLSGISNDMRTLEASDELHAQQAIDYFVYRVRREIGAMAAALEGLDAIVLTGGIGEHSVGVRRQILQSMTWLGIEPDENANLAGQTILSTARSRVLCLRIPTNEEKMIARHTQTLAK